LPIELDYTVAKLDPFRQWCGTDQEAKALCSAQPIVIVAERFQIAFLLEATRIASCTSVVDSVLSQAVSKLPVDRFHHLSPRRNCWRCCWVSGLFDWRDGSSWYCFAPLVSCALKHPNSFECHIPQMPHMLIVVGCVRSNIRCYCHHRSFLGLGQQICFIKLASKFRAMLCILAPGCICDRVLC
jgi:hypothetical protein